MQLNCKIKIQIPFNFFIVNVSASVAKHPVTFFGPVCGCPLAQLRGEEDETEIIVHERMMPSLVRAPMWLNQSSNT